MNPITILLADDHAIVREGIRKLLEPEPDLLVVGEAITGREAVQLTVKLRPAVVVMDIAMPRLNGLEAIRQIRKAAPESKVLVLSAHSDDAYLDKAIESGASGFLLKQSPAHLLPDAIRDIQSGKPFFSSPLTRRLHSRNQQSLDRSGKPRKKVPPLSSREMEVLQLIAESQPNKQAAAELGISIKTVEKHRQSLMGKLSIHDTAGLTRYAISAGIIESSVQITSIEEAGQ